MEVTELARFFASVGILDKEAQVDFKYDNDITIVTEAHLQSIKGLLVSVDDMEIIYEDDNVVEAVLGKFTFYVTNEEITSRNKSYIEDWINEK